MKTRLLAITAACITMVLCGSILSARPAFAAPASIDPPDSTIALTGVLHKVNAKYKLRKNNVPHLLDVSAVPLRASHLIGRNVRITGHLEDRIVSGVQTHIFVVATITLVQ